MRKSLPPPRALGAAWPEGSYRAVPCRAVPLLSLWWVTGVSLMALVHPWEPSMPLPSRSLVQGNSCPTRVVLLHLSAFPTVPGSCELCCRGAAKPPAPAAPAQPGGAALMCTGREDQRARLGLWGVFSLLCEARCLQGLQLTSDGKDARFRSRRRNMWETDSKWPVLLGAVRGSAPRAGLFPLGTATGRALPSRPPCRAQQLPLLTAPQPAWSCALVCLN